MIPQFAHEVQSSFSLWFDHHLTQKGQCFINQTGRFYYNEDERIPSVYKSFSSPYKQWVMDSSISGANIPSGVYIGGNFSGRSNGLILDFENGRVLASGQSTSTVITGSFAQKEFNTYVTNEDIEDLIIERKFVSSPKIGTNISTTYIPPYKEVIPAIYISNQTQENEPFAFGGEDKTTIRMNATVICENSYQLDGVLSLFADTNNKIIPIIPFSAAPSTEYGDIKGGEYNYETLYNQYLFSGVPLYIESAKTSKITDKLRKNIANDLYIGFIDFEVSQHRYPRV